MNQNHPIYLSSWNNIRPPTFYHRSAHWGVEPLREFSIFLRYLSNSNEVALWDDSDSAIILIKQQIISYAARSLWHHGAVSVLSERKRAGTCHAMNTNAGGSKGRKDDGEEKKFLAQEEELLFVRLRGVENEVKRQGEFVGMCSHFSRRVIIWRVEWQGANGHLHKGQRHFMLRDKCVTEATEGKCHWHKNVSTNPELPE